MVQIMGKKEIQNWWQRSKKSWNHKKSAWKIDLKLKYRVKMGQRAF